MNDLDASITGLSGQPENRDSTVHIGPEMPGVTSNPPAAERIGGLRAGTVVPTKEDDTPSGFQERLTQTEAELERLRAQLKELRYDWEREAVSELKSQFEALREAVLRYSFACAEVDMRLALIRARANDTAESAEILRHSLEEQTAASDELRRLARTLHQSFPAPER